MFKYVKAFLKYKPAKFENTVERWKRKGLIRQIGPQPNVEAPQAPTGLGRLREAWDNIIDSALVLLERAHAAQASVRGTQEPNRWRLHRLWRWEQHEARRTGPVRRVYWDDILEATRREPQS